MAKSQGFTLIELMMALTIMVFVGAAATVFLQNIISSRDQLEAREQALNGLDVALRLLQEDFQFHNPGRPVRRSTAVNMSSALQPEYLTLLANDFSRVNYNLLPALILEDQRLELTRAGSYLAPNASSKRSNLRRVQYQFYDDCTPLFAPQPEDLGKGCLLRHLLDGLDSVVREPNHVTQPLVTGLSSGHFEVLVADERGSQWQRRWPSSGVDAQVVAVRLTFDHSVLGEFSRLFAVPNYSAEQWSPERVQSVLIGRGYTLPGEMVR